LWLTAFRWFCVILSSKRYWIRLVNADRYTTWLYRYSSHFYTWYCVFGVRYFRVGDQHVKFVIFPSTPLSIRRWNSSYSSCWTFIVIFFFLFLIVCAFSSRSFLVVFRRKTTICCICFRSKRNYSYGFKHITDITDIDGVRFVISRDRA